LFGKRPHGGGSNMACSRSESAGGLIFHKRRTGSHKNRALQCLLPVRWGDGRGSSKSRDGSLFGFHKVKLSWRGAKLGGSIALGLGASSRPLRQPQRYAIVPGQEKEGRWAVGGGGGGRQAVDKPIFIPNITIRSLPAGQVRVERTSRRPRLSVNFFGKSRS